jgi:hypothetical protein
LRLQLEGKFLPSRKGFVRSEYVDGLIDLTNRHDNETHQYWTLPWIPGPRFIVVTELARWNCIGALPGHDYAVT